MMVVPVPHHVLVAGWGFLGSAVGMQLRGLGLRVRGLSRSRTEQTERAREAGVEMIIGALETDAGVAALDGVDHVVYAAGGLMPRAAAADPMRDVTRTLLPTISLFEQLRERTDVGVTYISSGGTVYGDPESLPTNELAPVAPKSPYGVSRCAGELYARMYRESLNCRVQIARCANVYGPGQPHDRGQGLVAVTLDRMRRGIPVTVYGDGRSLRDYVHIADVAEAIGALVTGGFRAEVVNVGSGRGYTTLEVISLIETMTGIPAVVKRQPDAGHEVRHSVLDITLLQSIIDFRPRSLESGVAELLTEHELRGVSDLLQSA